MTHREERSLVATSREKWLVTSGKDFVKGKGTRAKFSSLGAVVLDRSRPLLIARGGGTTYDLE